VNFLANQKFYHGRPVWSDQLIEVKNSDQIGQDTIRVAENAASASSKIRIGPTLRSPGFPAMPTSSWSYGMREPGHRHRHRTVQVHVDPGEYG
jgi:hypothetical protein